jgi:hypothetical protein
MAKLYLSSRDTVATCDQNQGPEVPVGVPKAVQEQTESRHNKAKSHQRETGANPCKEGPLDSQGIAQVGFRLYFRWRTHSCPPVACLDFRVETLRLMLPKSGLAA